MNYEEFEYMLHNEKDIIAEDLDIDEFRVKCLKDACRRFLDLRKMDRYNKRKFIRPVVKEKVVFGGGNTYIEYYKDNTKVCGQYLKGNPENFRCLRAAGRGTLHPGFGMCKEHEMQALPEVRTNIWLQIRDTAKEVPLLSQLALRAEKMQMLSGDAMDSDIAYLEIARQSILQYAELNGGELTREMRNDLAVISDISSKIKERKKRTEQLNWIAPEKVGAMILQVLETVTKGETPEVRQRIALRAQSLRNIDIFVPSLTENNEEIPQKPWEREASVTKALQVASKYVTKEGDANWGDIPEVAGYDVPKVTNSVKPVKGYRWKQPPKITLNLNDAKQ
jgi:hypothetical protein